MRVIARAAALAILAGVLSACGPRSEPRATQTDSARGEASFGAAPQSSPSSALVAFLEGSREGAPKSALPFDSLVTCQIGDGMYQPIELLASYHLVSMTGAGDTVSIAARITTVAEEDGSPTHPDRFVAFQRIKTDTQQWRMARTSTGKWRVCFGPQFGAYGSDRVTTWRPAGASYTSARRLADSIYRADPPSSRGGSNER